MGRTTSYREPTLNSPHLLVVVVVYPRTILCALVVPLSVRLGRVVSVEEYSQQFLVGSLGRIVQHLSMRCHHHHQRRLVSGMIVIGLIGLVWFDWLVRLSVLVG